MKKPVKAPSVGESITEVAILKWHRGSGEAVKSGDLILEIESDKATVEIVAESAGVLNILKNAGERIAVGTVIGEIDDSATPTVTHSNPKPSTQGVQNSPAAHVETSHSLSPAVHKMVAETGVDPQKVNGTGKAGRLTKGDVLEYIQNSNSAPPTPQKQKDQVVNRPGEKRVPMSMLRQKIADKLVSAQHTAAILTTFNEVNMAPVMELRNKNKDAFKAKHGVPLSFMSFFARACVEAIKLIPEINAKIDGTDVIYHDFIDIGVAVGTERGLVVPPIRGAHTMDFIGLEKKLSELATKARDGKLSIAELTGGTFTISNGGTYGSLLSTPILNYPQSGILGMHKIMDRPVVENGQIVIRPMMYLAFSYDHRLIDGKGAVTFLVHVKDFLENPSKLGFQL